MNKLAHAEMVGRDLMLRLYLGDEAEGLDKAASSNMEIDGDHLDSIDSMIDEVEFRDYQQKLAHNNGAFAAFSKVAEALEAGADAEALYNEISGAMNKIASSLPASESEDEDETMFAAMVKGASEMAGSLYGIEVDEDVVGVAAQQVANALSNLSDSE
jgi:hypothetical protein